MINPSVRQSGFSAVELLITIFIAAAFAGAGYQLYIAIMRDGSDARNQSTASNIAYDYIRRYTPLAQSPCATITPDPSPTIPTGNPSYTALGAADVSATIECPYPAPSSTTLITVTVTYGPSSNQKQVRHALYVTN